MELTADIFSKLEILSDAAKYDVACTSSGSSRRGVKGTMGSAVAAGLCHCFSADGRCISLLKILLTNECVYDCKYCLNRLSNDVPRASFTPEEIAELTISFYRRNYIEGLFLSSGIRKNPDFTMEQIYQAVHLLRVQYRFNGYIHVKAIPGADPLLIEKTGWLVDRMSANLELPTADGLRSLAPQKSRKTILTPMRQIQMGRRESRLLLGGSSVPGAGASVPGTGKSFSQREALPGDTSRKPGVGQNVGDGRKSFSQREALPQVNQSFALQEFHPDASFVPAGQSTQMIVGASGESDYEIVHMAEAMYQKFDLKRVFYSAFVNTTKDPALPDGREGPPLLREHRLYQADFLMRFYQFRAEEIISAENPFLNVHLDPKCNWALNHLEFFPVEVQTADYHTLLRIPGVGVKSARRIMASRRLGSLDYQALKKFGVVLKRAMYFITCSGKTMVPLRMNEGFILTNLLGLRERLPASVTGENRFEQMSLLDLYPGTVTTPGTQEVGRYG
ncbi:MAG: putative DNA modification/repair radical SAM protein [Eubacterium sp.]|nr:putative DNA modification/repair radical SAM protein [Eubacterium sp.]